MLSELAFTNFKSWADVKLPCARITGVFGTNSSGKTSLIQFLLLMKQTKLFEVVGPERMNLRVNAPAVLLCLDFGHAQREIGRLAGTGQAARGEHSLYPHFFSIAEEAGIVGRLAARDL